MTWPWVILILGVLVVVVLFLLALASLVVESTRRDRAEP